MHSLGNVLPGLWRWLTNQPPVTPLSDAQAAELDWRRIVPFVGLHLASLSVFWVGVSSTALLVALAVYLLRMFAITAFYHRYFSHRSFRTGRVWQFVMAFVGCTAGQRGPIWWASHHRLHHLAADTPRDPHSPKHRGFLHSHMLWFLTKGNFATDPRRVRDWMRYPELRWLERFDWVPFVGLAVVLTLTGSYVGEAFPAAETNGAQWFVWGWCISTIALYHATYTVNSLAHRRGTRRFETNDDSRNNWYVALLTLGEGWHNNHHADPASARQGLQWWEIDITYLGLSLLRRLRIVHSLREPRFAPGAPEPVPLHKPSMETS